MFRKKLECWPDCSLMQRCVTRSEIALNDRMADIERSKTETEAMAEDLLMAETLPQSEEFPLPSSGIEWFLTRRQRNVALGQMLGRLFREHWRWNGDDPHYWSKQAQYLRENCRGRPRTRREYMIFGERTITCASSVREEVSDNLAAAREPSV